MDSSSPNTIIMNPKLSHKKWRAKLKKMKRQQRRKAAASKNAEPCSAVHQNGDSSDTETSDTAMESESLRMHNLWLERERQAIAAIEAKKIWEEKEKKRIEEEEQKIRLEWQEREKKEREEEEKKNEEMAAKKKEQDKMLKDATANENSEGEWHNPLAPPTSGLVKERPPCPFFAKVGACRFGDRCSRFHDIPDSSATILIPNMYSHFQLDQGLFDEYDSDLVLEYEESEIYQHFKDFYNDAVPEFKTFGKVVQFKVCCNYEPHLRGNVYVQYDQEDDAVNAAVQLNGRWYGGRQLNCQFCNVTKWKNAICGLFHQKRCPKGKNCNFLHVFINPRNEYRNADYDHENGSQSSRRSQYRYSDRQRSRSRSPSANSNNGRRRRSSPGRREYSMPRERRIRDSDRRRGSEHRRSRSRSPSGRRTMSPPNKRDRRSSSRSSSKTRSSKPRSSSKMKQFGSKPHLNLPSIQDDSIGKQSSPVRKPNQGILGVVDIESDLNTDTTVNIAPASGTIILCGESHYSEKDKPTIHFSSDDESEEALRAKLMTQISSTKHCKGEQIQTTKLKKKHKKHKHKKHKLKHNHESEDLSGEG